jgi:hypothetical protein
MRCAASLAIFPAVIFSAHAALGQSIEPATDKPTADSTFLQAADGAVQAGQGLSVEARLLKTDCDVVLERVRMARHRIQSQLSNPRHSPQELLNLAADLLEKLVVWQRMARQLGRETPELTQLQRRFAELRIASARLEVASHRRHYESTIHSNQAGRPSPLAAPPYLRLERALKLADALMKLGNAQVELLDAGAGDVSKKELQEIADRLEERKKQLDAELGKLLDASTPSDISELIENAKGLVTEADRLVKRADEIAGITRETRTAVIDDTTRTMDLTRAVLLASDSLIQGARTEGNTEHPDAKLRQLMTRRLALLRDQFQRVHRLAQVTPTVTWLDVASVSERVLAAELDLCQTRQERITRRQQHLDLFRQLEAQVKAELRATGDDQIADPVDLEVARLNFEIELQRELTHAQADSKSGNATGAKSTSFNGN